MPEETVSLTVNGTAFSVPKGISLKNALLRLSFPVNALCGGKLSCGKCKVKVLDGQLSPVDEYERNFLTEVEELNGIRLSCNAILRGDCSVIIPAEEKTLFADVPSSESPAHSGMDIGVAIDLGTTTVAFSFVDLDDGEILYETTKINPQRRFGGDVITRIKSSEDDDAYRSMHDLTVKLINDVIVGFSMENEISINDSIKKVVISGNTCMESIAAGKPVRSLGEYPYTPSDRFGYDLSGKDTGLVCCNAEVYYMPCVNGFLGGDIVGAVLSAKKENNENTVLIDIGTNTEICIFGPSIGYYAASAPAGPAFEGEGILFGSGYVEGAIYDISKLSEVPVVDTVGEKYPAGICGSGLIKVLVKGKEDGLLDSGGNIVSGKEFNGEPAIFAGGNVWITQKDIRKLQLAKASVCAAVGVLAEKVGIDSFNIVVAGSFGSSLDVDSLAEIGMIPDYSYPDKRILGNGSLKGALSVMMSDRDREEAERLSKEIKGIDLVTDSNFEQYFIDSIKIDKN